MKKIFLIAVCTTLVMGMRAQQWDWARHLEGAYGAHMDEDMAGNIYTAQGISSGPDSWQLNKISAAGNLQWSRSLQGVVNDITEGAQRLIVAGTFVGQATFGSATLTSADKADGFVASYDLAGNLQWVKQVSGINDNSVTSVEMNAGGDVFVCLANDSSSSFEGASLAKGAAIVVLNSAGVLTDYLQVNGRVFSPRISIDQADNVYLLGGYNEPTLSIGGEQITCSDTYYGAWFLARLRRNGTIYWARDMGSKYKRDVANVRANGENFYLTEMLTYDQGAIKKFTAQGTLLWSKRIGSDIYGQVYDMKLDLNEDLYLTGVLWQAATFGSCQASGNEYFLFTAKLDSAANCYWVKTGQSDDLAAGRELSIKTTHVLMLGWEINGNLVQLPPVSAQGPYFLGRIAEGATDVAQLDAPAQEITVYPNPSTGVYLVTGLTDKGTLNVTNALGETVRTLPYDAQSLTFTLDGCPPGIYYLQDSRSSAARPLVLSR